MGRFRLHGNHLLECDPGVCGQPTEPVFVTADARLSFPGEAVSSDCSIP